MNVQELRDKYLGVPYRHKGRSLEALDCWGLIVFIYRDFGIEVIDLEDYDENWSVKGRNYFIENYYKKWQAHGAPAYLDLVMFENSKGIPYHAGVYLSKGEFIHCCKAGTVIGKLFDKKWQERLVGLYRYDGVLFAPNGEKLC